MNKAKRSALLLSVSCAISAPMLVAAQDDLIKASDIIGSDVSNGLNDVGQVQNVLLDEKGKSIEYLFFDTSQTVTPTRSEMDLGFVQIDDVDFSNDAGAWEVIVENTDSQRKPEELEVSRSEADHRLLSNLLEESIQFPDESARKVYDILIDPETAEVAYYTVEMHANSFFDASLRAIPASEVEVGTAGKLSSGISLAELDSDERYQSTLR